MGIRYAVRFLKEDKGRKVSFHLAPLFFAV